MTKFVILIITTGIITYFLRESIIDLNYLVFKDILGTLLNISSILLAIIGAWVAIIYPQAIGRVFKGESLSNDVLDSAENDVKYLSKLVEIIVLSAFILIVVLIFQFIAPLAKELCPYNVLSYAKYFSFFIISFLAFLQIYSIYQVILANYFFLNELRGKNKKAKVDLLHK